jgi:NADH-quinone oxidoreductase subunit J
MSMTIEKILFLVIAAISLGAALMVVSARKLIHSALWLIVTLFGVAVLYGLLDAGFLAVAQVVIYIGAIAILFIFAVMLTRRVMSDTDSQNNQFWWVAIPVSALLFAGLVWMLSSWQGFATELPKLNTEAKTGMLKQLGQMLVSPDGYVLPFELASVLLVAALIGAIWVAWDRK